MANVALISISIVQPKNIEQSNRVKIHLTPFDFLLFRVDYPKVGIVFPKSDKESDIISQLKASLSLALEVFYPFLGRVVKVDNEDDTTSFYIDCDGSNGVKFVHAKAENVTVSDIVHPEGGFVPDFINQFFLEYGIKSYQGDSNPLLALQVTELKDGVFLGASANHLVADGYSMVDFIHTWSKICSTRLNSVTGERIAPIRLREWFLDNIDYPIHIPNSEINVSSSQEIPVSSFLREKIFRFTKHQISNIKAKANEEITSLTNVKISSFQAVLGYLWRSIIRQSCLNREKDVHFKFIVGLRERISPTLNEKECFGNMITLGTTTTTVEELVEQGIGRAALRIKESVGLQTKESITTLAESWVKNIKILSLEAVKEICDTLIVGGSPHFNVNGINFGWGKPIAIRFGSGNLWNGKTMIYPGVEEGGMDVQTCLPPNVFVKLLGDNEFMDNVTIL